MGANALFLNTDQGTCARSAHAVHRSYIATECQHTSPPSLPHSSQSQPSTYASGICTFSSVRDICHSGCTCNETRSTFLRGEFRLAVCRLFRPLANAVIRARFNPPTACGLSCLCEDDPEPDEDRRSPEEEKRPPPPPPGRGPRPVPGRGRSDSLSLPDLRRCPGCPFFLHEPALLLQILQQFISFDLSSPRSALHSTSPCRPLPPLGRCPGFPGYEHDPTPLLHVLQFLSLLTASYFFLPLPAFDDDDADEEDAPLPPGVVSAPFVAYRKWNPRNSLNFPLTH